MNFINTTASSTNSLLQNPYAKVTESACESNAEKQEKEIQQSNNVGDKVTLSSKVAKAKTRELIGLKPVGKLKLEDFENASKYQKEIVRSKLEGYMTALGIDESQKISLTLDAKSNIVINEKFAGKNEFEQILNEDNEFSLSFRGMSANDDFLSYVDNLKTNTTRSGLDNFMNSNTSWDDIISSASMNMKIKSSKNPLETMLGVIERTPNYSFSFETAEKA